MRMTSWVASSVPSMKPTLPTDEREAEAERRQAVDVLQHEGRAGNPREQSGEAAREDAEMREKPAVSAGIPGTPATHADEGQRLRRALAQCLRQRTPDDRPWQSARRTKVTMKLARQPNAVCSTPPMQRRDDRCKRHDRAHQRQFAAGARARIEVAHDGAHDHDCARSAQRLEGARGDQRFDARGEARSQDWRCRTARARTAGSGFGRSGRKLGRRRSDRARSPPDRPTASVAPRRSVRPARGRCPASTAGTCRSTPARAR